MKKKLKESLNRFKTAMNLCNDLGMGIYWTTHPGFFIAYLQDTHELLLNKTIFKDSTVVPINVDMLTFALYHEIYHAILWNLDMVPPAGPYNNLPEEIQCDLFAIEMSKIAGMKRPERFAGYLKDLGT